MKKDLHIHTNFSDGQYSPKEILEKIQEKGITEFAITDHDNFEGAIIMQNLVKNKNIKYHIGVEISSKIDNFNVHLLCYDFAIKNNSVNKLIEELKQKRLKKLDLMIDFVKKQFNYVITKEEKEKLLRENNIVGKPHIYALISRKIEIEKEYFYAKMRELKTADTKAEARDVIRTFHSANGKVVLAHPKEIEEEYNKDSYEVISRLTKLGLDGLETKHSKHSKGDILRFQKYAKHFNLFETMGSDFHGEKVKPNVKLGVCEKVEKNAENIL